MNPKISEWCFILGILVTIVGAILIPILDNISIGSWMILAGIISYHVPLIPGLERNE